MALSEAEILSQIDGRREELAGMMQQLLRFPSVNPPGNEQPIADYVAARLKALGFDVHLVEIEKDRPNVIARLKGSTGSPRLLCYAHLDVVPPGDLANWSVNPFEGKRIGDKIFGRGAQDHKFPIAPYIIAADAIVKSGKRLKGDLVLTFVVDEETGGRVGFKHLVENGYFNETDAMIYGGIGIERNDIVIGANGQLEVAVTVRGKTAHTAMLEDGINAITKSVKVLSELQRLGEEVNARTDPLTGHSRMSINLIRAGDKINILPDKCLITIDRRLAPKENFEQAEKEIEAVIEQVKRDDPTINVELEMKRNMPPVQSPVDSEIVKVTKQVGEELLKRPVKLRGLPASSDYTWYVNNLKKPCSMFAITSPELELRAHAPNEYCLISDLVQTTKAYALTMMRYLGTAN